MMLDRSATVFDFGEIYDVVQQRQNPARNKILLCLRDDTIEKEKLILKYT